MSEIDESGPPGGGRADEAAKAEMRGEMLGAFLDGELSAEDRKQVLRKLEAGSQEIAAQLEAIKTVGSELRSWVEARMTGPEGRTREVDLWNRIEARIAAEPVRRQGPWEAVISRIQRSGLLDSPWLRPGALAPALASIAVAFIVGYAAGGGRLSPASEQNAAAPLVLSAAPAHAEGEGRLLALVKDSEGGGLVGDPYRRQLPAGTSQSVRLVVANSDLVSKNVHSFERDMPLIHRTVRRIRRGPVPGGLRAGGLDIEWIDTARRFKIIPADSAGNPPVIWLFSERE